MNLRILLLVITCGICSGNLQGKVRNGYESKIGEFRSSLKCLETILKQPDLPLSQRRQIKLSIDRLRQSIRYFDLTNEMLETFRALSPDLFLAVDTIKNVYGESVDVFVAFVPKRAMLKGIQGTTNLACTPDMNRYVSEYGVNTVSVRITCMSRGYKLLAHEFGHVWYQVHHLAAYMNYVHEHYPDAGFGTMAIGHNSHDPSGSTANLFEVIHHNNFKDIRQHVRIEDPLTALVRIRKTKATL